MRLIANPLRNIVKSHFMDYPTPINITYFWGFGSIAGFCLIFQLITGICLAMHYVPNIYCAFNCVEHIMRDVNYGWFLRYAHANGASMLFAVVYIHMARGLYYRSYKKPKHYLWFSGVLIFILLMATAFIGYVLPWGQMSFWGATVITNLFTAIPIIGIDIATWIWGGYSVDNSTLNRFFSLHYLLPFIIAGLSGVHLILLHTNGSENPLGLSESNDKVIFFPYFIVKDLFGLILFLGIFSYFVFFDANTLGHPDNYIRANPLVTPAHIVPEWYFLPFYAILRSIPDKLGGVFCMGLALVILLFLPMLDKSQVRSTRFSVLHKVICFFFVIDIIFLGWLGAKPVETPYVLMSQLATVSYFFFFFVIYCLSLIRGGKVITKKNIEKGCPYSALKRAVVKGLGPLMYKSLPDLSSDDDVAFWVITAVGTALWGAAVYWVYSLDDVEEMVEQDEDYDEDYEDDEDLKEMEMARKVKEWQEWNKSWSDDPITLAWKKCGKYIKEFFE